VATTRQTVLENDVLGWASGPLCGKMRQMLAGILHHSIDGRAAHDEAAASAGAFAER
jgi:hypothetical protein